MPGVCLHSLKLAINVRKIRTKLSRNPTYTRVSTDAKIQKMVNWQEIGYNVGGGGGGGGGGVIFSRLFGYSIPLGHNMGHNLVFQMTRTV